MNAVADASVDLVVTSPPYPMIEMWDDGFSRQNPAVADAFQCKDGRRAFELMHMELDRVWREVYRVVKDGGFACINIGDATRTVDGQFMLYPNHARILQSCMALGFNPLPEILWRKQTNAPNKFMGSGMLPAGAYLTLEHEFILILRKGDKRVFRSKEEKHERLKSALFWEERNLWFSDVWEGLKGTRQNGVDKRIRERSGAYPFELAYRLINMFSLRNDTVLDPFLGTGTTTLAAMATGRNSIGCEIDSKFKKHVLARFDDAVEFSNKHLENRIKNHLMFAQKRRKTKGEIGYTNKCYGFPVMTRQETDITFDALKKIRRGDDTWTVEYDEKPQNPCTPIYSLYKGGIDKKSH
jgi:DNA modification methylase